MTHITFLPKLPIECDDLSVNIGFGISLTQGKRSSKPPYHLGKQRFQELLFDSIR